MNIILRIEKHEMKLKNESEKKWSSMWISIFTICFWQFQSTTLFEIHRNWHSVLIFDFEWRWDYVEFDSFVDWHEKKKNRRKKNKLRDDQSVRQMNDRKKRKSENCKKIQV